MTDPRPPRKQLYEGRSFVPVEHFCRASGVKVAALQAVLDAGLVEGVFDESGRLIGVWDDALPGAEQLRQVGVRVASSYAPGSLRSVTQLDVDDQEGDEEGGSTWTMSW